MKVEPSVNCRSAYFRYNYGHSKYITLYTWSVTF